MVPHIANQGHSFKGAGQYYLHDKQASTTERVMWTQTINLPTNDPEKAFGWMAHTSMNAHRLKQVAGISTTSRKNKSGNVYAFSLAWHPHQTPDKNTLLQSALETLGLLQLQDHEAVIVAHNDTQHPHVHVICNLIHPENGKKAVLSYDRLILSSWAEEVERNDGKILCEQRVINNQERRERGQNGKLKLVKYKEKPLDIAPLINELYQQSDSGTAFQTATAETGFTLAKGDKRGFVLVDGKGKIYSLSRQLKGQRAKDISERLQNIQGLSNAKELQEKRKLLDNSKDEKPLKRDTYEAKFQQKIDDATIEEGQDKQGFDKSKTYKGKKNKEVKAQPKTVKQPPENKYSNPKTNEQDEHLRKLDEQRAWEQKTDSSQHRLEQEQEAFYHRGELLKSIEILENQLSGKETFLN